MTVFYPCLHPFFITGYRFLKVTSHLTGFLTVYLTILCVLYTQSELSIVLLLGISSCTGAAAGFISVLLRPVALVSLALQTSAMIACLILTLSSNVIGKITLTQIGCTMATIPILLVVPSLHPCACKSMVIVNTSVVSGALALTFLDVYVNRLRIITHVVSIMTLNEDQGLCVKSWALMSVWLMLALSGILFQTMFTARGVRHHHGEYRLNYCFLHAKFVLARQRRYTDM